MAGDFSKEFFTEAFSVSQKEWEAMGKAMSMSDRAAEYVSEYLQLKKEVARLDARAEELRGQVIEALGPDGAAPGKVWTFEGVGTVTVVKGRSSERLDRGRLARAGVDPALLDAATVRTEGKPSMRINAPEAIDATP
jgi:hypothetical protein